MGEIATSIKQVTDIVDEIAIASREQSAGIEQVHQAIDLVETATQQNAALVEEAAATAESLHDQARRFAQTASIFRLDDRKAVELAAYVHKALCVRSDTLAAGTLMWAPSVTRRGVPNQKTSSTISPVTTFARPLDGSIWANRARRTRPSFLFVCGRC
jgi:hypothetical protein